jgi:hypothetical protein
VVTFEADMRVFSTLVAFWMVMATCVLPLASAHAQSEVPLLVLRYNQPRIYYDKQLYTAVSKAVAIKPEVRFSVVSFVPEQGGEEMEKTATAQTNALIGSLHQMGIPQNRISVSREIVNDAPYHEIYLYVD